MPEFLLHSKIAGLEITGYKNRKATQPARIRYYVRCLSCGHSHTISHHRLQDRERRGTRYCSRCRNQDSETKRFQQITATWPAPKPLERANKLLMCVISTGQAGIPRMALDAALATHIRIGGWCPRGRKAEDGAIPLRYALRETDAPTSRQALNWNARDADGTLLLGDVEMDSPMARAYTLRYAKPCLSIALADDIPPKALRDWIREHNIRVLNVDGPRLSRAPDIPANAATWLIAAFAPNIKDPRPAA